MLASGLVSVSALVFVLAPVLASVLALVLVLVVLLATLTLSVSAPCERDHAPCSVRIGRRCRVGSAIGARWCRSAIDGGPKGLV